MVRGTIGDQPWGWTLGALGVAHRSVEVVLRSDDNKEYRITFDRGVVIAASSPAVVDQVTRVALTNHFIAAVQVNEIKRCLAAAPNFDEVDVLAAAANLEPDKKHKLRIRLLTQRAARTFSVDRGDFEIEDRVPSDGTVSAIPGIDVRAVIFMGARMNLSEDRMRFGLRKFGPRFVLKPGAANTLIDFNFTPREQPLLVTLRSPTSLAELEASHREVDPRAVQAVVYALASAGALSEIDLSAIDGACEPVAVSRESDLAIPQSPPVAARVTTATLAPGEVVTERVRSAQPRESSRTFENAFENAFNEMAMGTPKIDVPAATPARPELDEVEISFEGPLTRAITSLELEEMMKHPADDPFDEGPTVARTASALRPDPAAPRSMIETFKTGRATTVRPNALAAHEVVALIKERTALLARGTDHFTLLGVEVGAPIEDIHAAYVELARHLTTKRLAELGIVDKSLLAAELLAQVGIAFTVLTDRIRRTEYIATLTPRSRTTSPSR